MTEIIEQISKVLMEAGVEHYCDPVLKAPDTYSAYYRIHNKRNHNILGHVLSNDQVYATVRKNKPLARNKDLYGIDGKEITYKGYAKHYLLAVPVINGLINGKYTINRKKAFFIDIARER